MVGEAPLQFWRVVFQHLPASAATAGQCSVRTDCSVWVGLCGDYFCLALPAGRDASSGLLLAVGIGCSAHLWSGLSEFKHAAARMGFGLPSWQVLFHHPDSLLALIALLPRVPSGASRTDWPAV